MRIFNQKDLFIIEEKLGSWYVVFMSFNAKLDLFTVRIREKGTKKEYLDLKDVNGFNFIDEVSIYLKKNIYLFKIDRDAERTSRIEKNDLEENSLYCRIKVGKFGEVSEIVDTNSGSGVFQKEREHSDTIPLFFHIKMSEDSTKAFINIERRNNRTLIPEIKNIFTAVLENIVEERFIFELKPFKQSVKIEKFLTTGQLNRINFILKSESDYLDNPVISLKRKPKSDFPKETIDKIIKISKNGDRSLLSEYLPEGFNTKLINNIELELKDKNRSTYKVFINETIRLNNSQSLFIKDDDCDKHGNPTYKYLKEISLKLI